MTALTVEDALRLLRSAGEIALRAEDGAELAVSVREVSGGVAVATAPRFAVAGGMLLDARIVPMDGEPWVLSLVIDEAAYETAELARITLRPERLARDTGRRLSHRIPAGGTAWLEAVHCQDVVDGDRVDGTMVDVSSSGVAIASCRVLRRGDRLRFHGRFFSETVRGEVRVMSVRPGAAGRSVYGCQFLELGETERVKLGRILAGEHVADRHPIDVGALRALVADEPKRGWRSLRRAP
jgi:hypothetical protein